MDDSYRILLLRMIDDGVIPSGVIGVSAARYGYTDIVIDMIDRGARNYDEMARVAAENGHRDIVDEIVAIDGPNMDFDYIIKGALLGGHPSLVPHLQEQAKMSQFTYDRYLTPNDYPY